MRSARREQIEAIVQAPWTAFDEVNADVCVKHILEHSEGLSLVRARLVALVHEILGRARPICKKLVLAPANGGDQPAVAELDDFDLVHSLGKSHCLGEPLGLGSVAW